LRVAEGFHPDLSVSVPNHWAKHKNTSANPPKTQGIIECMERRLTAEDCLVVGAVLSEPVSGLFSLLTGKKQGKFTIFG